MKNIQEACKVIGVHRDTLTRIIKKNGIETTRGRREGHNSTMTFISDENIEVVRKIISAKKPKKKEKKVDDSKKRLEFFRVKTSNIYRVYEVKGEVTKFLGTCTEEKYYEFKNKFKGVK